MRTSWLYKKPFLVEELFRAIIKLDRTGYAKYHAATLNEFSKSLTFDALTVNILHLNQKGLPDGKIVSSVANVSKSVIPNYQRHLALDEFTPQTFFEPGSALFIEATNPIDYWVDTPIYRQHCTPYDFHWVIGVSYCFPHQKRTFVVFDYMRAQEQNYGPELTEFEVEYLSFPFYLGWLYQYGAICPDTLFDWLTLIADMPPARFRVLRAFFDACNFSASQFSGQTNITKKTVYRHVEQAFDELIIKKPQLQGIDGNANRLLSLTRAYSFLSFGASANNRDLPVRCSENG